MPANIICSEMRTGLREQSLRETVSFEDLIMSKDKYTSMPLWQMEATVFIILHIFLRGEKWSEIIKYLLHTGCLLYSVVWYDFMSKQTCLFFLTIANHYLT